MCVNFYKTSCGLKFYYLQHGSSLAGLIGTSMKKREKELLENGILLAAVVVDVSNMKYMTEAHEKIGREVVVQLVLRMKGMMNDNYEAEGDAPVTSITELDSFSDPDVASARKRYRSEVVTSPVFSTESVSMDVDEERILLTPPPLDPERCRY